MKNQFNKLDRRQTKHSVLFVGKGSFCGDLKRKIDSAITHTSLMAVYCKRLPVVFSDLSRKRRWNKLQPIMQEWFKTTNLVNCNSVDISFPAVAAGCMFSRTKISRADRVFSRACCFCMFSRACYRCMVTHKKISRAPRGAVRLFSRALSGYTFTRAFQC